MSKYNAFRVRDLVASIFLNCGMSKEDADITANVLIDANLCGRDSHGVLRVETYVNRLKKRGTNPKSHPILVRETPTTAVLDGNDTMGLVAAYKASELCRKKAIENGIAFVLVRNGAHYGAGGYWAEMIGQTDLFTLNISNTEPLVVPYNGKQIALGTNPVAIWAPGNKYKALWYDVATSTIAQGKLFDYKYRHKPLQSGWAVDKNGIETLDPDEAMYLTSFGGHKGYGIAVMIEAMTACLAGSAIGQGINSLALCPEKTNNVSYSFFAMRIDTFRPLDDFRNSIDDLIDYLHSIPPVEGQKVYYPGEIEFDNRDRNMREGIDIPVDLHEKLICLAREANIEDIDSYFVERDV
nr:Ldh family oxidoreductase [Clostridia bacterium]